MKDLNLNFNNHKKNSDRNLHNHIIHKYSYFHNLPLGVGRSSYLILGIFVFSFGLIGIPSAYAIDTCGLDIFDTSIVYDDLQLNDVSSEQTVLLSNPGNTDATLSINATDWVDATPTSVIDVINTGFSFVSGIFDDKTPLSLAFQDVGTLPASVNSTTYWQLKADLIDTQFTGDLSQTMNLRVTCDGGTGGSTLDLTGLKQYLNFEAGSGNVQNRCDETISTDCNSNNEYTTTGMSFTNTQAKLGTYGGDFEGTDYLQMVTEGYTTGDSITVNLWVDDTGITGDDQYMWNMRTATGDDNVYFFWKTSVMQCTMKGGINQNLQVPFTSSETDNDYDMYTCVMDMADEELRIYINGNLEGTEDISDRTSDISTHTHTQIWGNWNTGAQYELTGAMDEASLWYRELSPSEISTIYNAGTGLDLTTVSGSSGGSGSSFDTSNLLVLYEFDNSQIVSIGDTYSDDFSTNQGYQGTGSFSIASDVLDADVTRGGTVDNFHYDIGNPITTDNFVLRFKINFNEFTNSGSADGNFANIGMSAENNHCSNSQSKTFLSIYNPAGTSTYNWGIASKTSAQNCGTSEVNYGTDPVLNTDYYVELSSDATNAQLCIYTDPAYSVEYDNCVTTPYDGNANEEFFKISEYGQGGDGGVIGFTIDDVNLWRDTNIASSSIANQATISNLGIIPTLNEDFDTSTGWTEVGTSNQIEVNASTQELDWDISKHASAQGVYYDLGNPDVCDISCKIRYKLTFDSWGNPPGGNEILFVYLSDIALSGAPQATVQEHLGTAHRNSVTTDRHWAVAGSDSTVHGDILQQFATLPGSGTTYYTEWTRDGNTFTNEIFSDPNYSQSIEKETVSISAETIDDLRYFTVALKTESDTSNNNNNGIIDDVEIYDGYDWLPLASSADGTINGATTGTAGIINEAFSFDGSDDHIDLVSNLWSANSDGTFNAWIKMNSDTSSINIFDTAGGTNDVSFHTTNNKIRVHPVSGSYFESTTTLVANTWYMVTLVQGSDYRDIYINGVKEIEVNVNGTPETSAWSSPAGEMELGDASSVGRSHWDGLMDEVSIWNRALNASEISDLYNGGTGLDLTP